jgi:hypothetical protein
MPYQLRNLFCTICIFSDPSDPLKLFDKFKEDFLEDFLKKIPDNQVDRYFVANNECLKEFEIFFESRGKNCSDYGLPAPVNYTAHKEEAFCSLKEFILGDFVYYFFILKLRKWPNLETIIIQECWVFL